MDTMLCKQCGGDMKFLPGTQTLRCPHCGIENIIPVSDTDREQALENLDYEQYLEALGPEHEVEEVLTVRCKTCGAETTLQPNVTAEECPFCGTSLVLTGQSKKKIKPTALLPFKVTVDGAGKQFQQWIKKLWFAPNALKKTAAQRGTPHGVYIPYWIYNTDAETDYVGERGEHYYETEVYETVENGQTVTRTREVQRTRWYPASGHVSNHFEDLAVAASNSLPRKYLEVIEPWDLGALVPFDDQYLRGFRTESYAMDLKEGFDNAQGMMTGKIDASIRWDIGGDEQRIMNRRTSFYDTTFKHVLLPLWINTYRFKDKEYRFLINARTGEVKGERPWSWVKITLAAVLAIAVIGIIIIMANHH